MRLCHHLHTLVVITRSTTRVGILRPAGGIKRDLAVPVGPVDPHKLLTPSPQQVLLRVIEPAIDKVSVEAVAVAYLSACKLERRDTSPALWDCAARVIADREAQRRHPLHAGGTTSAVGRRVCVVGDLVGVDAVRKTQDAVFLVQ